MASMATHRERMLAGEPYRADDPELTAEHERCRLLLERFNATSVMEGGTRRVILGELLGALGDGVEIRPPLHMDYGRNTSIGPRTFVNFGAMILDCATVTIGADVQIATGVQLLTATHPLDAAERRSGWESAQPIVIGDDVWLGGGVIVCPGVTIGPRTVVGAGAVVVADLPADVVAVGSPARVVRTL
jgi:maltose O-acetyltransferase